MKGLNLPRPRQIFWSLILIVMIALTISCQNEPTESKAVRPVYYQIVLSENGVNQFSIPGLVANQKEAKLSFKVSGEITKMNVSVGQQVTRGSVIAQLNNANYLLNLTQAQAAYETANSNIAKSKKQLESVKSNYNRIERLYGNDHASLSEYENAKKNYENAKESLKAAQSQANGSQAKVNSVQNQLNYTQLLAPFNGTISQVFMEGGEMVSTGKPVVVLESLDDFEVEASVPENRINQLKIGQNVEVKIGSLERTVKGVIGEIAPGTKAKAGYPIKIIFDEKIGGLKSGMSAKVLVIPAEIEAKKMFMVIDPDAVSKRENEFFVYVLTKNEDETYTANERTIETAGLNNKGYLVTKGLQKGERIVTAGITFLYNGRIVRLKERNTNL
jgi:multidrug efflux system membrane fusion protein